MEKVVEGVLVDEVAMKEKERFVTWLNRKRPCRHHLIEFRTPMLNQLNIKHLNWDDLERIAKQHYENHGMSVLLQTEPTYVCFGEMEYVLTIRVDF
jgi:hypothetical protein